MTSFGRRGGVDRYRLRSGGIGNPDVLSGALAPDSGGGVPADEGSIYIQTETNAGRVWVKTTSADTGWVQQSVIPGPEVAAYGTPERLIYVRNGGDDNADGSSEGNAVATLRRAHQLVKRISPYEFQVIECSTFVETDPDPLILPQLHAGNDVQIYLTGDTSDGSQNFQHTALEYRAEPTLVQALTVNNVAAAATTDMPIITVDEVLVPDAHVGQFVIASSPAVAGTIKSNTDHDIYLMSSSPAVIGDWVAPVGIYKPSCELTYGSAGYPSMAGGVMGIHLSGLQFSGIKVRSPVPVSMYFSGCGFVQFQLCDLENVALLGGGRMANIDYCHLNGLLLQDGRPITIRSSFWHDGEHLCHDGPAGTYFLSNGYDNVKNVGSNAAVFIVKCISENAPGVAAFRLDHPGETKIDSCVVNDAVSHAIYAVGAARSRTVTNVHGAGNGGYGIYLANGAQVSVAGGTDVTGASGDVRLGAAGATAYAALPANDLGAGLPEMVRTY